MKSTIKYKLTNVHDKWYALKILHLDIKKHQSLTINYSHYNNQSFVFYINSYTVNPGDYLTDSNIRCTYDKDLNTYFWTLNIRDINKPILVELNKHQQLILNHSIRLWISNINNTLESNYYGDNTYYVNFKDLK